MGNQMGCRETQVEAVKGGRSGAMKRAAVQWGIGRYLYNLEKILQISSDKKQGWHRAKLKDGTGFYWLHAAGLGHASIMQSTITRKYQPEISIADCEQILKDFSDYAATETDKKN